MIQIRSLFKTLLKSAKGNFIKKTVIYFIKVLANTISRLIFALAITQDIATRKGD